MKTFIAEMCLTVLTPAQNLIQPSLFAKKDKKRFLLQALFYAISITTIVVMSALILQTTLASMNELYAPAMLAGSILLPFVITGIGLILHTNKPAMDKEYRLLMMLALPWHVFTSFLCFIGSATVIGSLYIATQDIPTEKSTALLLETLPIALTAGATFCFITFLYGLKNTRKTSIFQNSGDAVIIFAMLLLPILYHSLAK